MQDGARLDTPDGEIAITMETLGELDLPNGRIVALDPGSLAFDNDPKPFERSLPPGRYPVRLSIAHFPAGGERVALAILQVEPTAPVRFAMATKAGEDIATLEDTEFFGHGVDSGSSCFVDLQAARELVRRNQDWDYCWKQFPQLIAFEGHGKNVAIDPSSGLNLIAFTSGFGDGSYASYWGFDAEDRLVCLVTDFGLLGGRTCPICCAEVGKRHEFLCAFERCPYCNGSLSTCDCIATVLHLSEPDLALFLRSQKKILTGSDRDQARQIQARWKEALEHKGRVPVRAEDLDEDDEEVEDDD